jgi:hypothetical protein
MTRNSVARHEHQVVLACLGHATHPFGPAPPKLPLCQRNEDTKTIGRAPAISKVATATTGMFSIVASNAQSRLKIP